MWRPLFVALALVGCGSDSKATVDAPPAVDARPSTVVTVACPATPAATVTTSDTTDAYSPMQTTITQGQIVQFMTSVTHNVEPDADGDPGVKVGFNTTGCLMFTETGTFGFHCSIHLFKGSVVVN